MVFQSRVLKFRPIRIYFEIRGRQVNIFDIKTHLEHFQIIKVIDKRNLFEYFKEQLVVLQIFKCLPYTKIYTHLNIQF